MQRRFGSLLSVQRSFTKSSTFAHLKPSSEPIIRTRKRSLKKWRCMSNEKRVAYAQRYVDENNIRNRTELQRKNCSLYTALYSRKELNQVKFPEANRPRGLLDKMSNDKLVQLAQGIVDRKGYMNRTALFQGSEGDSGLYLALLKRNLLGRVKFPIMKKERRPRNFFTKMDDDKLISYAQGIIDKNKVTTRTELARLDWGLYYILNKRQLLDTVFP